MPTIMWAADERRFDLAVHNIFDGAPPTLAEMNRLFHPGSDDWLSLSGIHGTPSRFGLWRNRATFYFGGSQVTGPKLTLEKGKGGKVTANLERFSYSKPDEASVVSFALWNLKRMGVHELVVSAKGGGRAAFASVASTNARWDGPSPRTAFRDFLIGKEYAPPAAAEELSVIADTPRSLAQYTVNGKRVGREFLSDYGLKTPNLVIALRNDQP